jgi:hypothetical protein
MPDRQMEGDRSADVRNPSALGFVGFSLDSQAAVV